MICRHQRKSYRTEYQPQYFFKAVHKSRQRLFFTINKKYNRNAESILMAQLKIMPSDFQFLSSRYFYVNLTKKANFAFISLITCEQSYLRSRSTETTDLFIEQK